MSFFDEIKNATFQQVAPVDPEERRARRALVLDILRGTISQWAGYAFTLDEANRLLQALPDLNAPEFEAMPGMSETRDN